LVSGRVGGCVGSGLGDVGSGLGPGSGVDDSISLEGGASGRGGGGVGSGGVGESSSSSLDFIALQPVVLDGGDSEVLSGGGDVISVGVPLSSVLDGGELSSDSGSPLGGSVGSAGSTGGSPLVEDLLDCAGGGVGSVGGDSIDGPDVFVFSEGVEEGVQFVEHSADLGRFSGESLILGLGQTHSGSPGNGFRSGQGVSSFELAVEERVRVRGSGRHVVAGGMGFFGVGPDVALHLSDELVTEIVGESLRSELLTLEESTSRERESAEAEENEISDHSFNL